MDAKQVLEQVRSGAISVEDAEQFFRRAPYEELGYAKLDTHRKLRSGFGEVVFCSGKADEFLSSIFEKLAAEDGEVLGTRATPHQFELVKAVCPSAVYDSIARIIKVEKPGKVLRGCVAVCTAGTADIAVAEEAAQTAEFFGTKVERIYDVGVSGLHRLLGNLEPIQRANCVVAVAGMEGALASVVGGMVACPVIAVPTSVGYGASFGGVAALLAMLNSCASGVSVVNIDNGFGAGYQAHMIERAGSQHGEGEPDMKTLRWNLAENATRNQLLGDTLLQLPPDSRQRLEAAADAAGVPDRHHHDIGEVLATIDGLAVSPAVRDHMRAIYTILAEAEAAAHGCAVEQTHFHEVGDGSRIRNTLLVCLAVEATGAKRIVATVAQTGQGEVECAHGTLSIPAPATSAIIARGIPVSERTLPGERMTPTSAAMILHFVDEFQ